MELNLLRVELHTTLTCESQFFECFDPPPHTHTTACDHHSILSIWGAVSFDQPGGGLMSVDQSTCLPFFWRVGSSQEEANFFCINLMSRTLSQMSSFIPSYIIALKSLSINSKQQKQKSSFVNKINTVGCLSVFGEPLSWCLRTCCEPCTMHATQYRCRMVPACPLAAHSYMKVRWKQAVYLTLPLGNEGEEIMKGMASGRKMIDILQC